MDNTPLVQGEHTNGGASSNEVAELRAQLAAQQAMMEKMQQQMAAQQQYQAGSPYQSAPPAQNPNYQNPPRPGPAGPQRPGQQPIRYAQPPQQVMGAYGAGGAYASMCSVPGCRAIATQRCGSTFCCDTCNRRICVEHSGWSSAGRRRVPACPEHSSGCTVM